MLRTRKHYSDNNVATIENYSYFNLYKFYLSQNFIFDIKRCILIRFN